LGVVAVALVGLIIGFIYWLFTEKFVSGRGVIVAQYEPPRGLKPALAEVILKENTTDRALSATLIDLAVRGYLQIIEEPISIFMRLAKLFALLPITIIFLIVLWIMRFDIGVLIIFVLAFLVIFSRFYTSSHSKHDYTLKLLKGFDDSLANYELHYLKILFDNGQTEFSTKKLRESSNSTKREFGVRMEKSREIILKATDNFGDFYAVNNGRGKKKFLVWFVAMVAAVVVYLFLYKFTTLYQVVPQWFYIILAIIFVAAFLYGYIKFETRLNKEGLKLKEEILGFKLYLYTAERYRLANLTPDIFEKYLPYAMIFGVEKKWSKAFIGVKLDNPAWYHSQYSSAVVVGAGMSAGSFSASAFSASFVSSFSSSFSTSSGSGSAGGGSAGGGGGGGGGGAS
jgi:uncharacterized membrane protein